MISMLDGERPTKHEDQAVSGKTSRGIFCTPARLVFHSMLRQDPEIRRVILDATTLRVVSPKTSILGSYCLYDSVHTASPFLKDCRLKRIPQNPI